MWTHKDAGGFAGENPLLLNHMFAKGITKDPKDAVINIYIWRLIKLYGIVYHFVAGAGIAAVLFMTLDMYSKFVPGHAAHIVRIVYVALW